MEHALLQRRRMWKSLLILVVAAAAVGCGSTATGPGGAGGDSGTTEADGSSGGGSGTGGTDAGSRDGNDGRDQDRGDGGDACASAVALGPCGTEGAICGGNCSDACQFCNLLRCSGGRWQAQEAAPAPCFACGPSLRCQINQQYCYSITGGAVGNPPSYQCRAVPMACLPTPTCKCLRDQGANGNLCEDAAGDAGAGQITVTLQAP